MPTGSSAGTHYAELISEQLEEERNRKTSLEQRGVTVITTSGVVVSLIFGFSALVTSKPGFELGVMARALLVGFLAFFFVAAISGIMLNLPRRYREGSVADLKRLPVQLFWDASESLGGRRVAEVTLLGVSVVLIILQ